MAPDTRILVTGAGGFIGGWLVETLCLNGFTHVRGSVRRWSTAARIARFPVEVVACDLVNKGQVREAMRETDVVLHCAYGSHESTVKGTENLLEMAHQQGVKRFVHLSTIDVYGGAQGTVDERSPLVITDNEYGNSKIEAENLCWDSSRRGLPLVILRPTIVYGPHCKLWIAKFADRLNSGNWGVFKGVGEGTCNLVYVQDLVQAVLKSVVCEKAIGEAFNINGSDMVTWNEYFRRLNEALRLPPLREIQPGQARLRSGIMTPLKSMARYVVDNFGDTVTNLYRNSEFARNLMKMTENRMKVTPGPQELRMFGLKVHYPISKAESILGYKPRYDVHAGIDMSVQWLRHESMSSHTGPGND